MDLARPVPNRQCLGTALQSRNIHLAGAQCRMTLGVANEPSHSLENHKGWKPGASLISVENQQVIQERQKQTNQGPTLSAPCYLMPWARNVLHIGVLLEK